MLAITVAGAISISIACNDESSGVPETNDTLTTFKVDSSKDEKKMEDGLAVPIAAMIEQVKGMKMTEDFDFDYATLMIEHHQGAIDISEIALSKASDMQIKTIAQTMVSDHTSELEELKKFLNNHDISSAEHKKDEKPNHSHDAGNHNELSENMNAMMDKMKTITMQGDINKDYAMLMIAHHQNAVKLSENELSHGHHAELKKMAKKMIDDDNREITELQKWLSSTALKK